MNNLKTLIAASFVCFASTQVIAAPDEMPTNDMPPAQVQKDHVPNTTENGDFLEPQPADASQNTNENAKHKNQPRSHKKMNKDKKMKTEGKNTTEQPESGGADVKSK